MATFEEGRSIYEEPTFSSLLIVSTYLSTFFPDPFVLLLLYEFLIVPVLLVRASIAVSPSLLSLPSFVLCPIRPAGGITVLRASPLVAPYAMLGKTPTTTVAAAHVAAPDALFFRSVLYVSQSFGALSLPLNWPVVPSLFFPHSLLLHSLAASQKLLLFVIAADTTNVVAALALVDVDSISSSRRPFATFSSSDAIWKLR